MYFIMSRERARGGIMPYVINMCRIFTISEIPQTSPNCYAFVFAAIAMTFCCWALRCQAQRSHNTGWHVPIVCSHEWWETQHPCSSELDRGRQNIAIRPVLSRTNLSKKILNYKEAIRPSCHTRKTLVQKDTVLQISISAMYIVRAREQTKALVIHWVLLGDFFSPQIDDNDLDIVKRSTVTTTI